MINIDNIIKEFVEKKWSGKVVQIPRTWLTSVGSGLFYEVEGELTKQTEHAASLYHKPTSEHSSDEPEHTARETIWYFGLQISKDEGEVVGYWIKERTQNIGNIYTSQKRIT